MIHCLNVRRALLADPQAYALVLPEHLATCAPCRAFAAILVADEAALRVAICVPVPEQLQERILLQTALRARRRDLAAPLRQWLGLFSYPQRAVFAVGCSAALLLALCMVQASVDRVIDWGDVALAHVIGEADALAGNETVPRHALLEALASYGLGLEGDLGTLRMVGNCPMPGGRGVHVVIDTPDMGTLTLILPPAGVRTAGDLAQGEGFAAQVVRINHATIGLVTQRPDKLAALALRVQKQMVVLHDKHKGFAAASARRADG